MKLHFLTFAGVLMLTSIVAAAPLLAQEAGEPPASGSEAVPEEQADTGVYVAGEELTQKKLDAIETNAQTNEDPDAQRRLERETSETKIPEAPEEKFDWGFYGSIRVHAINHFDLDSQQTESALGDGASRLGLTATWQLTNGWNILGRLESGFDVLETFTPKGQDENDSLFLPRLYNIGFESDNFNAKIGKSWSAYYKVAGAADRFSIFGGDGVGIYNAGTDGGATGTGRADDALQAQFYIDALDWAKIKPFNLNFQYQRSQPIPKMENEEYDSIYSLSAWFETQYDLGIGLAYHHANVDDELEDARYRQAGIDGDATALAMAVKTYGSRWLVSLVYSRLENIETTDQFIYFDGWGTELFAQWEFRDRWWLTGGGNWLKPDEDQPGVGEFEIRYAVLGLRYTMDSFNRMFYLEWKLDGSLDTLGNGRNNELTLGVRWDFGY